jgi:hypothetical protein
MASTIEAPPVAYLRELFMSRQSMKFSDFGVTEEQEQFIDGLVELFHGLYPAFTIDNLLVRPREGIRYCDAVRQHTGYYDLPDDIILQAILNRRKHG